MNPRSARLNEALGREYLQQGQPELALREYQQAAERAPALPGIHLALAGLHADAQRWDDAAREVERELAVAPGSAAAFELKARVDAARACTMKVPEASMHRLIPVAAMVLTLLADVHPRPPPSGLQSRRRLTRLPTVRC